MSAKVKDCSNADCDPSSYYEINLGAKVYGEENQNFRVFMCWLIKYTQTAGEKMTPSKLTEDKDRVRRQSFHKIRPKTPLNTADLARTLKFYNLPEFVISCW